MQFYTTEFEDPSHRRIKGSNKVLWVIGIIILLLIILIPAFIFLPRLAEPLSLSIPAPGLTGFPNINPFQ